MWRNLLIAMTLTGLGANVATACDTSFNEGIDVYNDTLDDADDAMELLSRGLALMDTNLNDACVNFSQGEVGLWRVATGFEVAVREFTDSVDYCRIDGRPRGASEAREMRQEARDRLEEYGDIEETVTSFLDNNCR